jgi:hypothetical protein
MPVDHEAGELVRTSVRQALVRDPGDLAAALAGFGWADLVVQDDALAYTALFEEQGLLAVESRALDIAALVTACAEPEGSVVWPLVPNAAEVAPDGRIDVEGVALRADLDGRVFVPAGDALHEVAPLRVRAAPVGGMARDLQWVRVHIEGRSVGAHGSWPEVQRRTWLALASELTGVAQRMLDVAVAQVSTRRQFGRPVGAYQAVRHRLAEAHSDVVGSRALVAAAWVDGRPRSASWAKSVAGLAHDAVAKHTLQVCGAMGFDEEHELPALVRRGFALDALVGASRAEAGRIGTCLLEGQHPRSVSAF